jgi:HEAT repeat protein
VEGLVRVLVRGPDVHVGAAATRLAQLGDEGVDALRTALTEAVREDHQPIRQAALQALVLHRHRDLPAGLVRLTGDEAPEVRTRAIRTLAALGEGAAMPHVVPLLRDPEAAVREEAADAVWELTGGGVDLDFDADPEETESSIRRLEEHYRG